MFYILKLQDVTFRSFFLDLSLKNVQRSWIVDKLDNDKLKNVPTNLSNFESKVDKSEKLDKLVDKLVPVPVDLSKLSDEVKDVYNAKIKNIEYKKPDITNLYYS